jgi:SP family general alpha glucoside:H+ symporter-like MFS transporter
MEHTIEMEAADTAGSGWRELFTKSNRRRTEIVSVPSCLPVAGSSNQACVVWSCQYWCGQPISNFATE